MSSSLDRHLCFALYSTSRMFTAAYRSFLDEIGLTYPQFLVLVVLWEKSPRAVSELGAELQLDSGTLSPLLKRMEALGFIERVRDSEDERKVLVQLTPDGAALRERAGSVPQQLAEEAGVESAEIAELCTAINELNHKLRAKLNQAQLPHPKSANAPIFGGSPTSGEAPASAIQ